MNRREFIALIGCVEVWPFAAQISCVKAAGAEELAIPAGEPKMVMEGQAATPQGGRVVLYSRSRYGNYPLATYSFSRGLRGDDRTVGNDVELVFGNVQRENAFRGRRVDSVPGAHGPGNGSVGMDGGGPGAKDRFRVALFGGSNHRILDLGDVAFDDLTNVPVAAKSAEARSAEARANHVYVLRLFDRNDPRYKNPVYVKLKVLLHRDNDAILIEWKPLAG